MHGIGEWDKGEHYLGLSGFSANTGCFFGAQPDTGPGLSAGFSSFWRPGRQTRLEVHPYAHLWDNGANPVDELGNVMEIRQRALNRFGENNIRPGNADGPCLEDALVPVYLYHRYQTTAVTKLVGGCITLRLGGDGRVVTRSLGRRAAESLTGSACHARSFCAGTS